MHASAGGAGQSQLTATVVPIPGPCLPIQDGFNWHLGNRQTCRADSSDACRGTSARRSLCYTRIGRAVIPFKDWDEGLESNDTYLNTDIQRRVIQLLVVFRFVLKPT